MRVLIVHRTYVGVKGVRYPCIRPVEVAVIVCVEGRLLLSTMAITVDVELLVVIDSGASKLFHQRALDDIHFHKPIRKIPYQFWSQSK